MTMRKKEIIFWVCALVFIAYSPMAHADIFKELSNTTTKFASGLRNFAFGLSCFGIIMFTFLAICGKINFKHLGYIFLCLFMVSGVGALINYLTVPEGGNLAFSIRANAWESAASCTSSLGGSECDINVKAIERKINR